METIEMTFLPLGRALAEFYSTLLEAGMDESFACLLTDRVLASVLADERWKDPPQATPDIYTILTDQEWDDYIRGLTARLDEENPPPQTQIKLNPLHCDCGAVTGPCPCRQGR